MKQKTIYSTISVLVFLTSGIDAESQLWTDLDGIPCNNESAQFIWRYADHSTLNAASKDSLCRRKFKDAIVIYECDPSTGKWLSSWSLECSLQLPRNLFCPEDLLEIPLRDKDKFICLKISEEPHQFEAGYCSGSDTLAVAEYLAADEEKALIAFLKTKHISTFWLPARRALDSKFSPYIVMLPGNLWAEPFDIVPGGLTMRELLSDNQCLSSNVSDALTLRSEMTSCDELLYSVCVSKKYVVSSAGCPDGFGAISYRPNECFGITWQTGIYSLSVAEYFEKRGTLQLIFKEMDMDSDEYFLLRTSGNNSHETDMVKMNRKENIRAVSKVSREPVLHRQILADEHGASVTMVLRMDSERENLILIVYNGSYIWRIGSEGKKTGGIKCFTNADYEERKRVKTKLIWRNDPETQAMYELKVSDTGPGYYWCEAHTIFNFSLIVSKKIVVTRRSKGHTFAMACDIPCERSDCLSVKPSMKYLSKVFKQQFEQWKKVARQFDELSFHNGRLMRIESIVSNSSTLNGICHVTVSLKTSAVDNSAAQSSEEEDSEENELGIRHDTSVRMRMRDLLTVILSRFQPDLAKSVKSTESCFPETFRMDDGEENQWLMADLGQTATALKLCLQNSGLPVTRACEGNFMTGAYWTDIKAPNMKCIAENPVNIITQELYDIDFSRLSRDEPEEVVENLLNLLGQHDTSDLIPADFYYLAKIMQTAIKRLLTPKPNLNGNGLIHPHTNISTNISSNITVTLDHIVSIYSYLMNVNDDIIRPAALLNATNMLLNSFESLIDEASLTTQFKLLRREVETLGNTNQQDNLVDTIDYVDVGVVVKVVSNVVIFIIDPSVANITGIALYGIGEEDMSYDTVLQSGLLHGAFENEFYRFILANQTVDDLLYEKNLQLATYVPQTLWERLDEISRASNTTAKNKSPARVVVKVYSNDILFQENRNYSDSEVEGKIISVAIPGHDTVLPEMFPLVLRVAQTSGNNDTELGCRYWNYETWANDGLRFLGRSEIDNALILCGCSHMTPFAYLMRASYNLTVDYDVLVVTKAHEHVLDLITLLGCSLSLFGITGIFITAVAFATWRQKASSKVLLQLSAAIAMQMILFCFINTEKHAQHLIQNEIFSSCIALGASLHYSVLVQFCWMSIIAYLQFKRYVQIFGNHRPKRFFIKSTLLGWGAPLIPVLIVLIFNSESYIPPKTNTITASICYPSGYSLYLGVILPISLVIAANLIIFVLVLVNIFTGPDGTIRHVERKLALSQVRLSILLFFLLGFTWIFGLMTTLQAGLVFSYLFCLTATLQGFVLFLYFIILDPVTRHMWGGYFQRIFRLKPTYENSTSMKETTQTTS